MPVIDDLIWNVAIHGLDEWKKWLADIGHTGSAFETLDQHIQHTAATAGKLSKTKLDLGIENQIASFNRGNALYQSLGKNIDAVEAKLVKLQATQKRVAAEAEAMQSLISAKSATRQAFQNIPLTQGVAAIPSATANPQLSQGAMSAQKMADITLAPLAAQEAQLKTLQTVDSNLKRTIGDIETLKAAGKQGFLPSSTIDAEARQITTMGNRVKELKTELITLSKLKGNSNYGEDWSKRVGVITQEVGQLEFAMKHGLSNPNLFTAQQAQGIDLYAQKLRTMEQTLTGTSVQIRRVASDMSNVSMQIGFTALAFGAMTAKVALDAANFEKQMAEVNSVADITDTQFKNMKQSVLAIFANLPVSDMKSFTTGLYDIMSDGYGAAESVRMLDLVSRAAITGQTDLATATKAGIGSMRAYGKTTADLESVLDAQFKLVERGQGRYKDFQVGLARVDIAAKALGYTINDTYAALALLTRIGMPTRQAEMTLSRMMQDIIPKRTKIKEKLGIDVVDKATGGYKRLVDIIGEMRTKVQNGSISIESLQHALSNAMTVRGFQALLGVFDQLQGMTVEFSNNIGTMNTAFNKATDNAADKLQKMKNAFAAMVIEIGNTDVIKGSMNTVSNSFTTATNSFRSAHPILKDLAAIALVGTTAFTGLSYVALKAGSAVLRTFGLMFSGASLKVTAEIAKMSLGFLKLGTTATGALVATDAMNALGVSVTSVTVAVQLLRFGLYGLVAAAVIYGIYKIYQWTTAWRREAQSASDDASKWASELRQIGVVTDKNSDAFKKQKDIIIQMEGNAKKLGSGFDAVVEAFKQGKLTAIEMANALERAAKAKSELAKTPGWFDLIKGTLKDTNLPGTGGLKVYRSAEEKQRMVGEQTFAGHQAYDFAGDLYRELRKNFATNKGAITVEEMQKRWNERLAPGFGSIIPGAQKSLSNTDVEKVRRGEKYLGTSMKDLYANAAKSVLSIEGRDVSGDLSKLVLTPEEVKKIQQVVAETIKKSVGLDQFLKEFGKDLQPSTVAALRRELANKPLNDAVNKAAKYAIDQVTARTIVATEYFIKGGGEKNSKYAQLMGKTIENGTTSALDIIRTIIEQSLNIKLPKRDVGWIYNEAEKAVKAGYTGPGVPTRNGRVTPGATVVVHGGRNANPTIAQMDENGRMIEQLPNGGFGYRRSSSGRTGRTLEELRGSGRTARDYYVMPSTSSMGVLESKGAVGFKTTPNPATDSQLAAMNDKSQKQSIKQLDSMRRQLEKEIDRVRLEGQIAQLRTPSTGYGQSLTQIAKEGQAQIHEAAQRKQDLLNEQKARLDDELSQIQGHEEKKKIIWDKYAQLEVEISRNTASQIQQIQADTQKKLRLAEIDFQQDIINYRYNMNNQERQLMIDRMNLMMTDAAQQRDVIKYQAETDRINADKKRRDDLAELEKRRINGQLAPGEYGQAQASINRSYQNAMVNATLNAQKKLAENSAQVFKSNTQAYNAAVQAVQEYERAVVEASGNTTQQQIRLIQSELKVKLDALDREKTEFLVTAALEQKTAQEVQNFIIQKSAEAATARVNAARQARDVIIQAYRDELDTYISAQRAIVDANSAALAAFDDSVSTRAKISQNETQSRLNEIDIQEKEYLLSAKIQGQSDDQIANKREEYAAQRKKTMADEARYLRDMTLREMDDAVGMMKELTAVSGQQGLVIAQQMDSLYARMGVPAVERSRMLTDALKEATNEERDNIETIVGMLDLPVQEVVKIRRDMIEHGIIFGKDAVEAERQNMKDLLQDAIGLQVEYRKEMTHSLAGGIGDLLTGKSDFKGFLNNILETQRNYASKMIEKMLTPSISEGLMTPEEKKLEQQAQQMAQSDKFRGAWQQAEGLAQQAFRESTVTFAQAVQAFAAASNAIVGAANAPKTPVLPEVPTSGSIGNPVSPGNAPAPYNPTAPYAGPTPWLTGINAGQGTLSTTSNGKITNQASSIVPPGQVWQIDDKGNINVIKGAEAATASVGIANGGGPRTLFGQELNGLDYSEIAGGVTKPKSSVSNVPVSHANVSISRMSSAEVQQSRSGYGPTNFQGQGNSYVVGSSRNGIVTPTNSVNSYINEYARKYGINPNTLRALIMTESGFRPNINGAPTKYGTAQGLGQLLPSTFNRMNVGNNPYDVKQNIEATAKYIAEGKKQGLTEDQAAGAGYFQGMGWIRNKPNYNQWGSGTKGHYNSYMGYKSKYSNLYPNTTAKPKKQSAVSGQQSSFANITPTAGGYWQNGKWYPGEPPGSLAGMIQRSRGGVGPDDVNYSGSWSRSDTLPGANCGVYATRTMKEEYGWGGTTTNDLWKNKYANKYDNPKLEDIQPGQVLHWEPKSGAPMPAGHFAIAMRGPDGKMYLNEQYGYKNQRGLGIVRKNRSLSDVYNQRRPNEAFSLKGIGGVPGQEARSNWGKYPNGQKVSPGGYSGPATDLYDLSGLPKYTEPSIPNPDYPYRGGFGPSMVQPPLGYAWGNNGQFVRNANQFPNNTPFNIKMKDIATPVAGVPDFMINRGLAAQQVAQLELAQRGSINAGQIPESIRSQALWGAPINRIKGDTSGLNVQNGRVVPTLEEIKKVQEDTRKAQEYLNQNLFSGQGGTAQMAIQGTDPNTMNNAYQNMGDIGGLLSRIADSCDGIRAAVDKIAGNPPAQKEGQIGPKEGPTGPINTQPVNPTNEGLTGNPTDQKSLIQQVIDQQKADFAPPWNTGQSAVSQAQQLFPNIVPFVQQQPNVIPYAPGQAVPPEYANYDVNKDNGAAQTQQQAAQQQLDAATQQTQTAQTIQNTSNTDSQTGQTNQQSAQTISQAAQTIDGAANKIAASGGKNLPNATPTGGFGYTGPVIPPQVSVSDQSNFGYTGPDVSPFTPGVPVAPAQYNGGWMQQEGIQQSTNQAVDQGGYTGIMQPFNPFTPASPFTSGIAGGLGAPAGFGTGDPNMDAALKQNEAADKQLAAANGKNGFGDEATGCLRGIQTNTGTLCNQSGNLVNQNQTIANGVTGCQGAANQLVGSQQQANGQLTSIAGQTTQSAGQLNTISGCQGRIATNTENTVSGLPNAGSNNKVGIAGAPAPAGGGADNPFALLGQAGSVIGGNTGLGGALGSLGQLGNMNFKSAGKKNVGGGMNMISSFLGGMAAGQQEGGVGSFLTTAITGFMTGGPLGLMFGLFGMLFGKGSKKKDDKPKQQSPAPTIEPLEHKEDTQWATVRYVRRALEGGREGLPLGLTGKINGPISTKMIIQFARIELVGVSDPRTAGAEFAAGLAEGPARVIAQQISSGSSQR